MENVEIVKQAIANDAWLRSLGWNVDNEFDDNGH